MENNKKRASGIYDFASVLVSAIIAVTFIFTFLFKISSVNGPSMLDSFHNGDRVFITAAGYQPKYGDVVIISQPNQYNEVLIKRIIAVGGQTVDVDATAGTVTVDGKVLYEPYIREQTLTQGNMNFPLTVPEGYVFVMGDNRNHSTDSRYKSIGLIDERYIMGKAFYRVGDKRFCRAMVLVMNDTIKQNVQWFPGHMAKTRRKIKESLPLVDAVVEILDARIPRSSQNPEIAEIIGEKPHIAILNKCDIADDAATKKWLEYFRQNGIYALALDCKTGKGLNRFVPLVNEVLKDKIQSNIDKGMAGRQIRLMVVGIPNTGKSSFINKMAGKKRAEVADKAGVTRHNQWFAIGGGLELLDSPGVLWPKFEDPEVGDKLAFVGSVKDQVVDIETLAVRFLRVMRDFYPERLTERYKIENFEELEPYEILELIGKKRGMIMRGGVVDTERASVMLLDEYRGGKLGKITLDGIY